MAHRRCGQKQQEQREVAGHDGREEGWGGCGGSTRREVAGARGGCWAGAVLQTQNRMPELACVRVLRRQPARHASHLDRLSEKPAKKITYCACLTTTELRFLEISVLHQQNSREGLEFFGEERAAGTMLRVLCSHHRCVARLTLPPTGVGSSRTRQDSNTHARPMCNNLSVILAVSAALQLLTGTGQTKGPGSSRLGACCDRGGARMNLNPCKPWERLRRI